MNKRKEEIIMSSEQVLVFPEKLLYEIGDFSGFNPNGKHYLHQILDSNQLEFLGRDVAEDDPTFKQLIPYHILKSGNLIFVYQRAVKSGESRLRNRWSLGIGGHINDQDGTPDFIGYHEGRNRELAEEVKILSGFTEDVIGVIYDDKDDVGRVHFGVIHALELDRPEVEAIDPALSLAAFLPIDSIKEKRNLFENWSQIVIDNFF